MAEIANSRNDFYLRKWDKVATQLNLSAISADDKIWLRNAFIEHGLSFSQARQMVDLARQLKSWNGDTLASRMPPTSDLPLWDSFVGLRNEILLDAPDYGKEKTLSKGGVYDKNIAIRREELAGPLMKRCPAYSEGYRCCGLEILNTAENCTMGCSYCILQLFYEDREVRVRDDMPDAFAKLEIELPKNRITRMNTGQYSDSLLLGNRMDQLQVVCDFARRNPQVLLELKTKTLNVSWILEHRDLIPNNIYLSWSINTEAFIANEEQNTPANHLRLEKARAIADTGLRVGFHLHPMARYKGAETDYHQLALTLVQGFQPEEVVYLSQGSVNFLPVHRERLQANHPGSQLLKTPLENIDAKKLGYPVAERIALYRSINEALTPWEGKVLRYLCMEPPEVVQAVLGYDFAANENLLQLMNDEVYQKCHGHAFIT